VSSTSTAKVIEFYIRLSLLPKNLRGHILCKFAYGSR
jgi:hypothetical protein